MIHGNLDPHVKYRLQTQKWIFVYKIVDRKMEYLLETIVLVMLIDDL